MRNSEGPQHPETTPVDDHPETSTVPAEDAPARPRGDRYIRAAAVLVVLALAFIAAFVSYHHQYALAVAHGEPQETARLFPLVIDGVIGMASLVMLYCARLRFDVPRLAYLALWSGIGATLAANAAQGWTGGWTSRLVSAAPAAVLVIAYELLMWLIRTMRARTPEKITERIVFRDRPVEVAVEVEVQLIPADKFEAARWAVEDAAGKGRRLPGRRALADRFGLEAREAIEILAGFEPQSSTGHSPAPPQSPIVQPLVPPSPPVVVNGAHPAHVPNP